MAPGRAESDFGLKGWIDALGLKQIFLIFSVTYVLHFSCVLRPSQEKLKTMLMQNVGGQIQIGFIMGKVEVAYCEYSLSLTEKKKTSYSIFLNR